MATEIAKTIAPGSNLTALTNIAINWQAADIDHGNKFSLTPGRDLLLARLPDPLGDTAVIRITGPADRWGRSASLDFQIAESAIHIYGPFNSEGWMNTDGCLYVSGMDNPCDLAVIELPN